jgi:hypothetical protein
MKSQVLLAMALGGALAAGSAYATNGDGAAGADRAMRLHVVEHAVHESVVDSAPAGDSAGDLLTFHNPVYDRTDTRRVGRDMGECTRIVPGSRGSWECRWTTFLRGGSLTVEGPFFDTRSSTLAVTGGTGRFRDASGQMRLRAHAGGKFDFTFMLAR